MLGVGVWNAFLFSFFLSQSSNLNGITSYSEMRLHDIYVFNNSQYVRLSHQFSAMSEGQYIQHYHSDNVSQHFTMSFMTFILGSEAQNSVYIYNLIHTSHPHLHRSTMELKSQA